MLDGLKGLGKANKSDKKKISGSDIPPNARTQYNGYTKRPELIPPILHRTKEETSLKSRQAIVLSTEEATSPRVQE